MKAQIRPGFLRRATAQISEPEGCFVLLERFSFFLVRGVGIVGHIEDIRHGVSPLQPIEI